MSKKSLVDLILAGACLVGASDCGGRGNINLSKEWRNYGIYTETFTPSNPELAEDLVKKMTEIPRVESLRKLDNAIKEAGIDGIITPQEAQMLQLIIQDNIKLGEELLAVRRQYKQLLPSNQQSDYQKIIGFDEDMSEILRAHYSKMFAIIQEN